MPHTVIGQYLDDHFPFLDPALRSTIASIGFIREIPAGGVLMRSGEFLKYTMLVAEGSIKVYRESPEEGEIFMYELEPGNACALSMICATTARASEVMGRAEKDAVLVMLPIEEMETLMKEHKSWYRFVVESYRSRFEEILEVLDSVAFRSMDERLQHYLGKQSIRLHTRELKLTHHDIASDLNSSREVISRLLKKMEQRGLVSLGRNIIEIKFVV
ncbi:Crp/Fnr family transcriptional regulator [uncultured Chitinophaga sp.]|uniref:Crp/Fnr family transcriptional regulator n=1 Tax=uncultured Chitinophaga sp. TaxID=339340 RepID=UPI0025E269A7|nr:Crp/Fnr family transcriptional regulator [uncultured Chitinophaga sp.]